MRDLTRGLLLLATVALTTGCNAPGARDQSAGKLSYPEARLYDFMDMFELNMGAGAGLHVAAAVEPIRVGYGYTDACRYGMMGRAAGVWDESREELFVGLHDLVHWEKDPCCGTQFLFDPDALHYHNDQREPENYTRRPFYSNWGWITRFEDWEKEWLDVTLEAHLLFLSLDVGFSPQESVDFLLGLAGIDCISHDDYHAAPQDALELGG